MQWLLVFLFEILQKIFTYFVKKHLYKTAVFLAWTSFTIGLFLAFLVFVKLSIAALQVAAPAGVSLAVGFFPGITFDLASLYLTILIAKRVYDWKQALGKSYYETKGNLY